MSVWSRTLVKGNRRRVVAALSAALLASPGGHAFADEASPGTAPSSGQAIEEWSLEQLLNIDITTVSKTAQKESEAPGVISVMTQDEIRRFGGTTLHDLLTRIPGLVASSVFMTDRSVIAPRGDQLRPSSSNVLLLINGRPVREVLEGGIKSEFLQSFPVDAIERIEVVKGPGSVLYGSNAMSAVINVITKTPSDSSITLMGMGANGGFGSSGTAMVKSGDLEVLASVSYHRKDPWETAYSAPAQAGAPATEPAPITIPDEGPGAFVDARYKGLRMSAAYAGWENSYFLPDFAAQGGANWTKSFANVGYDRGLTSKWRTALDLTYSKSTFEVDSFPQITRDSHEMVAEWTNSVELPHRSQLVFGGLYNQMSGTEVYHGLGFPLNISDAKRSSLAGYAQLDYRATDYLKLIGGFQVNKIEDRDANVVPRLGVILLLPQGFHAKALYSEAFRAPGINELSLAHPQLRGNPLLQPELLSNFDLSVGYQGGRGQVAASYFSNRQKDIIVQDRSVFPNQYDNLGKAKIDGFEVEGKVYLSKQLFFSGAVLYQNASNDEGSEGLTPIAGFSTKTGLSYQWDSGHTLSVFNAYQGDIDPVLTGSTNPRPGSYNLLYLHGRLDLSRALHISGNRQLSLLLQVDNLLNEEIWLPAWGMTPGESIPYNQGRAAYVGISATF